MFRPFGNLVRLPDGRTLQKQTNGMWIDVNTGVRMNDTMVGNLMYSSLYYGVPDGGVGKKPRATIIGIAGSLTITQWLQDTQAGNDSIDFAWIGDSNVAKVLVSSQPWLPNGFVDNFVWAGISSGMRMYGSPVAPAGGPTTVNSTSQNSVGYYVTPQTGIVTSSGKGWTSGISGGPAEFINEFGVSLGNFSSLGGNNGLSDFGRAGYAWVGSGSTAIGNGVNWYIGNTGGLTGLDTQNNLWFRMIAGTTGNVPGVVSTWYNYISGSKLKYINVGITGGFTAYGITLEPTAIGNTALNFYFSGLDFSGYRVTGPVGIAMTSLYNPVKGIASSTLHECAGQSLGQMWKSVSLAGISANNNTVVNYLKEYYNRQRVAGGSGRVCVAIHGGTNVDDGSSLTDKAINGANYIKNIVSFVTSEWSRAGLPNNNLTFLVFTAWEQGPGSDLNTINPIISGELSGYAKTQASNVTYVDVYNFGGVYAGLTANGYYNTNETGHLSASGYRTISKNIMDALLKNRTR